MRIKNFQLEVPSNNPFKNDKLSRAKDAEVLTNLLKTINEPFVLMVDAGWGKGKTTFLQMWLRYLENDGFFCLYHNALLNDFAEDPMIACVGEIKAFIEKIKISKNKKDKAKKYLDKAKNIGLKLSKSAVPKVIQLVTSGVVDKEVISGILDEFGKERIESYEEDKSSINDFKENLEGLVDLVLKYRQNKRSFVFLIDELDRCRPHYAIEFLERIKHVFDATGVIFVLALNKEQLTKSVKALYGSDFDANGYLRRFFDYQYQLPDPSKENFIDFLYDRFNLDYLLPENKSCPEDNNQRLQIVETLSALSKLFNLSLRDLEQSFTIISIIYRIKNPYEIIYFPLLVTLIALKISDEDLYKKIILEEKTTEDILLKIKRDKIGNQFLQKNHYGMALKVFLEVGFLNYKELRAKMDTYSEKIDNYTITRNNQGLNFVSFAIEIIQKLCSEKYAREEKLIPYHIKKIQASEQFEI
jgi:hypothetical protein